MTNPYNDDSQNPYGSFPESTPENNPADNSAGYGAFPNNAQQNLAGLNGTNPEVPGVWRRFLSVFVDGIIAFILSSVVTAIIAGRALLDYFSDISAWSDAIEHNPNLPMPTPAMGPIYAATAVSLILILAYRSIMEAKLGATLGRMATGTKVIDSSTGGNISITAGFKRSAWWAASGIIGNIPLVGWLAGIAIYIIIAVQISRNPQSRHFCDKWANAQVLYK